MKMVPNAFIHNSFSVNGCSRETAPALFALYVFPPFYFCTFSLHLFYVAPLTIGYRECYRYVAYAAVFAVKYLDHRILCRSLFYADKNFRMAELTAIPRRMLLVRKYNVGHSFQLCRKLKIL